MSMGVRCLAYCLMGNHYHFVLRTDEPRLSEAMQWLEARYAEYFNVSNELVGHLFQGRFHSLLIDTDRYLYEVLRYVVLNPVCAHICPDVSNWAWSSYAATVGDRSHAEWFDRTALLRLFSTDDAIAVGAYVRSVRAAKIKAPALCTPARLKRLDVDETIRAAYATGRYSLRDLAKQHGVSSTSILRALRRGVTKGV